MKRKIAIGFLALQLLVVSLDILTNAIPWQIFFVLFALFVIGIIFLMKKEGIIITSVIVLTLAVWIWTESIYEKFYGVHFNRSATFWGRLSVLGIGFTIYACFRWVIGEATRHFIRNLWNLLSNSAILRAVSSFIVVFIAFVTFYGLIYASFFAYFGDEAFHVPQPPAMSDFLYFSAVTATTLGFGDIYPTGGVTKLLTVSEVVASFIIASLYLGAVVGKMATNAQAAVSVTNQEMPTEDHPE